MSHSFFIDTNVIVYSFGDLRSPKRAQAEDLIARAIETEQGVISSQVIQEFLNLALRKFEQKFSPEQALTFLDRVLWPLCRVFPNPTLFTEAVSISQETGWGFYDSLIVSAAVQEGCRTLFTEDLQAGRVIRGVEIRNPFEITPPLPRAASRRRSGRRSHSK